MDFLKKNGFWIACFFLVAAMIGTWFYASGAVAKVTASRVSAIKSAKTKVDAVKKVQAEEGIQAHPNKMTQDGMKQKIDVLSDSIVQAWELRYAEQRDIMKWPAEILPQDFLDEFNKWDPPELLPAEEKGQSVRMKQLLRIYKQQIPIQMRHICSVIKTNWEYQKVLDEQAFKSEDSKDEKTEEPSDESTEENETENPKKNDPDENQSNEIREREIVQWNPINQKLWLDKLTLFNGRDDNVFQTKIPSPSQVYMLQQDLWLLEAMFEIIRNVNAELDENGVPILGDDGLPIMVPANDLAPVKVIDHVVFGREALSLLGEITDTINKEDAEAASTSSMRGGGRRGRTKSKDSDESFAYLGSPAFHGRYVNSNLEPIQSDTVRTVLSSDTMPADNLELLIAKRVPVRLAVQMDEREIPRFLTECANSPFAFEVWQVRINKHDPSEVIALRGSSGGESSGRGGGGRGDRGGFGSGGAAGMAGFGGGFSGTKRKGVSEVALRKSYDVGVEFYGIVKIYNPVNRKLLGIEQKIAPASP